MPRSLFLNTSSQEKEPKFVREMADSKFGAEKVQNEPGTSCCARKQRRALQMMGIVHKAKGPTGQIWGNFSIKINNDGNG